MIADPNPARRDRLAHVHAARVVGVDEIARVDCDIFAPCALGGTLDDATVGAMKARLICGAANNQLAAPEVGALLLRRGIAYAPDYVVNAGGIISVSAEYLGEEEASVAARVAGIAPRVTRILRQAEEEKRSPAAVADEMAEAVIAGAQRAVAA